MATDSNPVTPRLSARKFEPCCDCIHTQTRCSSELCSCFREKRVCNERCETSRFRGDCLNQAICKCSCSNDKDGAVGSQTPGRSSKSICAKSEKCECVRQKETCSSLCKCKQICKNKDHRPKQRIPKPKTGCTCAKSKRQCARKDCSCRGVFEFCSANCKCQADCSNSHSKFHIPKHIQTCFLEHKNESSGLVLTLIGDDYLYRTDFYHDSKSEPHVEEQMVSAVYELINKYKVDLYEIVLYVSKSPCFHQDCDPKCEVVEDCKNNKACSKLLGVLLSKVRKETGKVDVRMSVKFLYPHLQRGDLYTKQGILNMMHSGITVEPLLMKEWSAIMDWHHPNEHKGEYLKLWNDHQLDKAVAQSQSFINECRRSMGMPMQFWVAEIHEIVKNTILSYTDIRNKLQELNEGLKQLDLTATPSKIRSTPSKRRSFLDMLELRDRIHITRDRNPKSGSNQSLPQDDPQAQQMVASFCGRSFDDTETNEIAQRIRRATANVNLEIESLLEFLGQKGN